MSGPLGLPDRYRLDGLIATGGMAAVYAAHDTILDRPVAVKVLAEHLTENVDAKARFEREARAAAALSSHPAVVTIYDVGEHEGRSFIVMERRMGGTLAQVIQQGPVTPERALGWIAAIAEALDTAHQRGVVHRDIKPGNLLLDEHDRVAVADFGIASLANEATRVTRTGEVLGTGAYLAPEQAAGDPPGTASDRYALAVVAYELLTGEQPFTGTNFAAQIRAHAEEPPPAAPGLPAAAQDVLKQGMAKEPSQRWATATAFAQALRPALEGAQDRTEAMTRPNAPVAAAAFPPTRDDPPARRRPPLAAVAVALVGGALLVSGLVLASTGDDDSTTRANAGQSAEKKADRKPRRTPTPVATSTVPPDEAGVAGTPEPTEAPAEDPTAEPEDAATGGALSGDPNRLEDEGYAILQSGDAAGAIPYLRGAVEGCGESLELDPCAYAHYSLGVALAQTGDYAGAISLFTTRLERWPTDQRGTVKQALREACANAGGAGCGDV